MNPTHYAQGFREILEQHADPERAANQRWYLKDKFFLFGLKQGPRRALFKEYMRTNGIPPVDEYPEYVHELYAQDEREFHYCAIELAAKYTRSDKVINRRQDIIEFLVLNHSWWDSVDAVVSSLIGPFFTFLEIEINCSFLAAFISCAMTQSFWEHRVSVNLQNRRHHLHHPIFAGLFQHHFVKKQLQKNSNNLNLANTM